jgi:DNA-binding transcriptional ArsR family regulator/Ni2+-binding GTPase involved in maturation of urease and hydrogenase
MGEYNFAKKIEKKMRDSDYKKLNLVGNPFLPISINDKEIPELFGRDKELDILARYTVDMLNDQLESIAIIGTKGIGKTHLLLFIFRQLIPFLEKGNYRIFLIRNPEDFLEFRNTEPTLDRKKFLFIDDCEQIWYKYPEAMKSVFEKKDIKVIACWNQAGWNNLKKTAHTLPKSTMTVLQKLDTAACSDIILNRLEKNKLDKNRPLPFTKEAIDTIVGISNGVPYTITTLADKCIQAAIGANKEFVDEEISNGVAKETGIGFRDLGDKLLSLTKTQNIVLVGLWEMTTSFKRAVLADDLAKFLGMNRSAVVQHLLKLEEIGLLGKQRAGRYVRYYIKPMYLETIERYVEETNVNH